MLNLAYLVIFVLLVIIVLQTRYQRILRIKNRFRAYWSRFIIRLRRELVSQLERLARKLAVKPSPEIPLIQDLAPSADADPDGLYSGRILAGLLNDRVKNIAITGPYSSGKSSILKAFQNRNADFKYLNITLATFADDQTTEDKGEQEKRKSLVEQSILQQMFYHVHHRTLPGSRFKRIRNLTNVNISLRSVGVLLWIVFFFIVFKETVFDPIPGWSMMSDDALQVIKVISVAGCVLLTFLILYSVFSIYRNSRFDKIDFSGSVEISPEDQSSILNKYLDEVLYFFEVTKFNVVIFEDLDRFRNLEIFTRLRELNTLINNAQQINRKVAFIYSIKDDVFPDERRTKFFDYIVPVIPVVNISNSAQILVNWIKTEKLESKISSKFLSDIGLYIDDMRVLKNVMNEFSLYQAKLKGFSIRYENLLALVIYKNKHPDDFALLHNDQGVLAGLFASKKNLLAFLSTQHNEKIAGWLSVIKENDQLIAENVLELRAIYLNALFDSLPAGSATGRLYLGNEEFDFKTIKEDSDLFNRLVHESKLRYMHIGGHVAKVPQQFQMIEKAVNPQKTYEQREADLKRRMELSTEQAKANIEAAKAQVEVMSSYYMKDILALIPNDQLDEKIRDRRLLLYLVRNGYIEEDYHYYISQFYEGTLTRPDLDFLRSVKDRQALPFDYALKNVFEVLNNLRIIDFSVSEILNVHLVDFLWSQMPERAAERKTLINLLRSGQQRTHQFIETYRTNGRSVSRFVNDLGKSWPGWWSTVQANPDITADRKDEYLKLLITYCDIADLSEMNIDANLTGYISRKTDFMNFAGEIGDIEKVKEFLVALDVRFKDLETKNSAFRSSLFKLAELEDTAFDFYPKVRSALTEFIYEKNLYELNPQMVTYILKHVQNLDADQLAHLQTAHLTTIFHSGCEKLIAYINKQLNTYLRNVVLKLETNTEEEEETILSLLNRPDVGQEEKQQLIEQQQTKLTRLTDAPAELWSLIVKSSRMQPSWTNVLAYFKHFKNIDESLRFYLDKPGNDKALADRSMSEQETGSDVEYQTLAKALLTDPQILNDSIKTIAQGMPYTFFDLELTGLSKERIAILIRHQFIGLTVNHFNWLKEQYPELQLDLLLTNFDTYLTNRAEYPLEATDYIALLTHREISLLQRRQLIETIEPLLIEQDAELNKIISKKKLHRE
jgi:hypothetical protein